MTHSIGMPGAIYVNSKTFMRTPKRFYVYIMTNRARSHVLYTGVTGNLSRRLFEHKNKLVDGLTKRYNLTRLVYYECFFYPDAAIDREKEIKGWRRSKKIHLIESMNPRWHDLAERWADIYKPESATDAGLIETDRPKCCQDP
jgi:putative endonuclease